MYGLVNEAIEQLLTAQCGPQAWTAIRRDAGVSDGSFIAMQAYPDEVTYALVESASRHTGLSADQLLEAFGEYWIRYTAEEGYGPLLNMAGTTFREFLGNLDRLHKHVASHMPELVPPSFRLEELADHHFRLYYHSHRPGLAPMVVGLLRGLGARFHQSVTVSTVTDSEDSGARQVFDIVCRPLS